MLSGQNLFNYLKYDVATNEIPGDSKDPPPPPPLYFKEIIRNNCFTFSHHFMMGKFIGPHARNDIGDL